MGILAKLICIIVIEKNFMMDAFHTTHCIQCVMAIHCDIQGHPMGNMSPNVCQIWDGAGPKIP